MMMLFLFWTFDKHFILNWISIRMMRMSRKLWRLLLFLFSKTFNFFNAFPLHVFMGSWIQLKKYEDLRFFNKPWREKKGLYLEICRNYQLNIKKETLSFNVNKFLDFDTYWKQSSARNRFYTTSNKISFWNSILDTFALLQVLKLRIRRIRLTQIFPKLTLLIFYSYNS